VKNVEQITRDSFPVLGNLIFINTTLQSHDQFIAVLLNYKSNELLDRQISEPLKTSPFNSDNSLESRRDLPA